MKKMQLGHISAFTSKLAFHLAASFFPSRNIVVLPVISKFTVFPSSYITSRGVATGLANQAIAAGLEPENPFHPHASNMADYTGPLGRQHEPP